MTQCVFELVGSTHFFDNIISMPRTQRSPTVSQAVAKRLVAVMEELDLSLSDASRALNYKNSSTLHAVRAGRVLPDISRLTTLAEEHAVNLHWLITGEGARFFTASLPVAAPQSTIDVDLIKHILKLPEAKKRALLVLLEAH